MVDPEKRKLVNGKPVDDEDPEAVTPPEEQDERADSPSDEGSNDVPPQGSAGHSKEPAGTGSPDDENNSDEPGSDEPGSEGFTPPTSGGEIRARAKSVVERLKNDGPEPVREAAKGLVDRAFDTVDAAFDRWFGKKE